MDIRQLNYFIEVAKQKSFTKASNVLFLSQPTLSKMIKNLEKELDVTLIDRSARQIELTDAGEALFAHGQKILDSFDSLSSVLYDITNLKQGKIEIGLPPLIGFLFFPKIIKGFREKYPHITIKLTEHGANKIQQNIEEGLLDLGLVVLPVDERKFDVIEFACEELMLFVHPSHPLAAKKEAAFQDLTNEPFILFSSDFTLHSRIIEECAKTGFQPNIVYESSQWDFISGMVAENLGVTIFPESISKKITGSNITGIPITRPSIPWHLGIILKKGRYVSYVTREFIRYLDSLPKPD
jgi:DNA-binding transcriptional LysR family regulator